jgi:hypothetical protein
MFKKIRRWYLHWKQERVLESERKNRAIENDYYQLREINGTVYIVCFDVAVYKLSLDMSISDAIDLLKDMREAQHNYRNETCN